MGLPGSGKSTWFARRRIQPLSSDLLRQLLLDDVTDQSQQTAIFSALRWLLRLRLGLGRRVHYVDATNLNRRERRTYFRLAASFDCRVDTVFFDVPFEVCRERNARRGRRVPRDVMLRMARKLRPPTYAEGFRRITVVNASARARLLPCRYTHGSPVFSLQSSVSSLMRSLQTHLWRRRMRPGFPGPMFSRLQFAQFRLRLVPEQTLFMPARNKGNVLRGALGTTLRTQCCHPRCPGALSCDLRATCPYAQVFEPAPPPGSPALSNYQAIPRPFVIRPPVTKQNGVIEIDEKTQYAPGETLEFGLILVGRITELLPHFLLSFDRLAEAGLGLNRARCRLERVEHLAPLSQFEIRNPQSQVLVRFLTPTDLVFEEKQVREPEFHHLVRRLRDRLNALATFYCGGPLQLDFRGLAERARAVGCLRRDLHWEERQRRSARTGRRHSIGGFLGESLFGTPTADALAEFLPLLHLGQYLHVGKHAVWGNGWYEIQGREFSSEAQPETQRKASLRV